LSICWRVSAHTWDDRGQKSEPTYGSVHRLNNRLNKLQSFSENLESHFLAFVLVESKPTSALSTSRAPEARTKEGIEVCARCVAADNFKDFDHARHENIFLTQGRFAVSP
jgi:hypothetical protein